MESFFFRFFFFVKDYLIVSIIIPNLSPGYSCAVYILGHLALSTGPSRDAEREETATKKGSRSRSLRFLTRSLHSLEPTFCNFAFGFVGRDHGVGSREEKHRRLRTLQISSNINYNGVIFFKFFLCCFNLILFFFYSFFSNCLIWVGVWADIWEDMACGIISAKGLLYCCKRGNSGFWIFFFFSFGVGFYFVFFFKCKPSEFH